MGLVRTMDMGGTRRGCRGRGYFATLDVPKLEEMVYVMLSGWLMV